MTIENLYKKLIELGVEENSFYLNGLFGSENDNNKLSLTIVKVNDKQEYQVYYKERGERHSKREFYNENDAFDYFLYQIQEELTMQKAQKVLGLGGMTVNERLWATGLMDEYDIAKRKDKIRAKQILRIIGVDTSSINKILGKHIDK